MIGREAQAIKVICSGDDRIACDVILISWRWEDRLNKLPCDADWMVWLHVQSTIYVTEDTWGEICGSVKSVRSGRNDDPR